MNTTADSGGNSQVVQTGMVTPSGQVNMNVLKDTKSEGEPQGSVQDVEMHQEPQRQQALIPQDAASVFQGSCNIETVVLPQENARVEHGTIEHDGFPLEHSDVRVSTSGMRVCKNGVGTEPGTMNDKKGASQPGSDDSLSNKCKIDVCKNAGEAAYTVEDAAVAIGNSSLLLADADRNEPPEHAVDATTVCTLPETQKQNDVVISAMGNSSIDVATGVVERPSQAIAKSLACDICGDILKDPHTCLLCLHSFCFACIYPYISLGSYSNTCPVRGCGELDINGFYPTKLGSNPFDEKKQTIRFDAVLNDTIKKIFPRPGLDESLEHARMEREAQYRREVLEDQQQKALRRNSSLRMASTNGPHKSVTGCEASAARGNKMDVVETAVLGEHSGICQSMRVPTSLCDQPAGEGPSGGTPAGPAFQEVSTHQNSSSERKHGHGTHGGSTVFPVGEAKSPFEWWGSTERRQLRQTAERRSRMALARQSSLAQSDSANKASNLTTSSFNTGLKRHSSEISNSMGSSKRLRRSRDPNSNRIDSKVAFSMFPADFFLHKRSLPPLDFNHFLVPDSTTVGDVKRLVQDELNMEDHVFLFCRLQCLNSSPGKTMKSILEEVWMPRDDKGEKFTLFYTNTSELP